MPEPLQGIVEKSTGSSYRVRLFEDNPRRVNAILKGKLRLQGFEATNPISVGDNVALLPENENTYLIEELLPRNNYIIRKSTHNENKYQILCANISQAFFIATIENPFTPLSTIDRFLVSAGAYHIPVTLVFNKTDLLKKPKHQAQLQDYIHTYTHAGYRVITGNIYEKDFLKQLQEALEGQITFLGGVSGAGKSTLINCIQPHLHLKTNSISSLTYKGKHTTTHAEMFELTFGGYIIDAPGVREFHIVDIEPYEVSHYFPEMLRYLQDCKFANCMHVHEPDCAVRKALLQGLIPQSRYHTYLRMISEIHQLKT